MTAARVDLSLDQGSDFAVQIYWASAENRPFAVVEPMRADIKNGVGATALSLTSGTIGDYSVSGITYNSESGLVQLFITAEDSDNLAAGNYIYDLFVSYTDTQITQTVRRQRLVYGTLTVAAKVTEAL